MESLTSEWETFLPVNQVFNDFVLKKKKSKISNMFESQKLNVKKKKTIKDKIMNNNGFHEDSDHFKNSSFLISKADGNINYCNDSINSNFNTSSAKRKTLKRKEYPGESKKKFVKAQENSIIKIEQESLNIINDSIVSNFMSIQDMLEIMDQDKIYSFRKLFPPNIIKIAEGSFGEVYSGKNLNDLDIIFKISPFEPDEKAKTIVNGGPLNGCWELIVEYVITHELSKLKEKSDFHCDNFVKMHKGYIINGTYPKILLDAWKAYKKNNEVFNENPCEYKNKVKNFMVLELENGGTELEKYELTTFQAYSVVFQLIHSMRIAEYLFNFEHRDLHESNILIQNIDNNMDVEYIFNSVKYKLKSFGVKIKIIDYTFSKITLNDRNYFLNLEEFKELFEINSDSKPFQKIYPKMRKVTNGDWSKYYPKNNLLWIIHHIKRFFSLNLIKDEKFVKYFSTKVSKMECLEELVQDKTFIRFQKKFIYL
ncbi:Serine/threonine-protein kinase haspin [Strongyloides ratti]|uniref:Serine/threonine-protein kinase haspin n=1 Tax=Strongyloides ratti TaxID=34506 RepID=A0A090LF14_STRRB|nr:Serine/threonine-protein kinase haspin [Strongyloides ratti]CEF66115.1 Serine/threonine-protein kinase haspin [Strongyloides ratti]